MTPADIIGFIGYVPLLGGTYLLTTPCKIVGWAIRIVGDVILMTAGFVGGMWSIVFLSLSFAIIDTCGLRKEWRYGR